jgi:hypothetical protein
VDICQRLMAGGHPAEVAARFEVTESLVYQIRRGQIWTHIVTPQTVATMMAIGQDAWAKREITQDMRTPTESRLSPTSPSDWGETSPPWR